MPTTGNWHKFYFPSTIECGVGCARSVGRRLRGIGAERPLVVADKTLMESGVSEPILHSIEEAGCIPTLYTDVRPNPTDKNVYGGTVRYHEGHCDSIVAIGGGSILDAAKAIRIVVAHPNPLPELYADVGGIERIHRAMPRLISLPTTAGTGSEVSRVAMITDTATHRKRALIHPRMTSTIAMLDPELTIGLPPFLTATTGADALSHCIEAYVAPTYHPIADGIALEGIRLIRENLPLVLLRPDDLNARSHMLMAATMGALAFQKGLGAAHSIAHSLAEEVDAPHGLLNAVALPHVMEFNHSAAKSRLAEIARAMGVDVCPLTPEEAERSAIESVREFLRRLEIPLRLQEIGVSAERIPALALAAYADSSHATNPRRCTEADFRQLFESAF